jgi:hypothetical protein
MKRKNIDIHNNIHNNIKKYKSDKSFDNSKNMKRKNIYMTDNYNSDKKQKINELSCYEQDIENYNYYNIRFMSYII